MGERAMISTTNTTDATDATDNTTDNTDNTTGTTITTTDATDATDATVVFSEAVRHTGAKWTLQSHARNAILLADNHSTTVFHEPKECMNAAVVAALSPRAASTSGREPLEWRSGDQCPRIVFFSNIERFTSLGTCQRLRSGLSLGLVIALPIELLLIPLDDFLRRECS